MNIHSRKYYFIITVFVFTLIMGENSIIINEINYNSADSLFPKDWVELLNVTSDPINIGNWIFKDDNDANSFEIPENQILLPGGYIVICDSKNAFNILFPDVENIIGNFDFNLRNGGELIRLFNNVGQLVDSLHYDDEEPWPLEADGDGPTLELIDPELNNALPSSWMASEGFGTPGSENFIYLSIENAGIPEYFNIESIYPNPFNPKTNILYSLDKNAMVTFMIYDINGVKIEELLNEYQITGKHQYIWDASSYHSGVYILKLLVDGYSRSAKLTLIK